MPINEVLEEKVKEIVKNKIDNLLKEEENVKAKIREFKEKIASLKPEVALILGSGFKDIVELDDKIAISFEDLGLKYRKIAGHSREFILGKYKNIPLIIASRVHYYETGDVKNILKFFNILKDFGIKTLIATTAVGAVNEKFKAGDLMLIKDHINLTGNNPLIAREPIMFLDISNAYDRDLRSKIKKIAKNRNVSIHEGIHIQVSGPSYETPAEVKAFRRLGADTISMSTALDCISANYFGIKFVAFAGITNSAVTNDSEVLLHDDVVKIAGAISKKLSLIIKDLLPYLNDINEK